jgi:2-amino-4-hydroxy-6-hydroxymethyldihydropteridine diphosphokinase
MNNNLAFIGLGGNLDNPQLQLDTAVKSIIANQNITLLKKSKYYITKPYGYLEQDNFINSVIKIKTSLNCFELLNFLQSIELQQKRSREIHWGPRTIDLDILCFDNIVINHQDLIIPHPDLKNRLFVLKPWAEIEPDWLLPDGTKIIDLLQALDDQTHQ